MYCKRCGNTLFFKRVINGCVAIPLEVEDLYEDDDRKIHETGRMEIISIHDEYYECGECGSLDIDKEEENDSNEYI